MNEIYNHDKSDTSGPTMNTSYKGRVLKLVTYPDQSLRVKCNPITDFNNGLNELVMDMVATMDAHGGLGLAAPQVGVNKRVFVVSHFHGKPQQFVQVYCNPVLDFISNDSAPVMEGCLSFPGASGVVVRPSKVSGVAYDISGNEFRFDYDQNDLNSVAIFHEYDHLDGVCLIDRMGKLERRSFLKRYHKNRK